MLSKPKPAASVSGSPKMAVELYQGRDAFCLSKALDRSVHSTSCDKSCSDFSRSFYQRGGSRNNNF
ncbi:hypothetical protein [Sinorhizobium sp. BJ1]|uniref:hypothetical protein n=1 Tax=Sinorhizobium sp. BJ1 TaxID=2035455 RepID=UPI0011859F0B|nr:hypothetical protein [Sinorhizobium sp. BJ1]